MHRSGNTLFAHAALFSGIALLATVGLGSAGCSADTTEEPSGASHDQLRVVSSFTSKGTAYYPHSSALEGGFNDRLGKKLRTLQQFLNGSADYVSVAMDTKAFKYGQRLRIKELEEKYGRTIVFRVVDTGGAFRGKGRSRMDICVANNAASLDPVINGTLHVDVLDETSGPAEPDETDPPPSPGSSTSSSGSSGSTSGSGRACTNDGACNPGGNGAGEICSGGRCVSGCRSDAQCPGNTTCESGQCE